MGSLKVGKDDSEVGEIMRVFRILTPTYISKLANMELNTEKENLTDMIKESFFGVKRKVEDQ